MKSLRAKTIKINNKDVELIPWSNIQLSQYEGSINNNSEYVHNVVKEILLDNNVKCNQSLTLLDEKIALIELYKLSKSETVNITYNCKNKDCEAKGVAFTIDLDEDISYKELEVVTIQTDSFEFNLKKSSSYRIDINNDSLDEALTYLASYVDSFEYDEGEHQITDYEEFKEWLVNECPRKDFDQFVTSWNEVKPSVLGEVTLVCEYCSHEQKMEFNLINFLVS